MTEPNFDNFEFERTDKDIEGGFFNVGSRDFDLVLSKDSLLKVLNGEEVKSDLFWRRESMNIRNLEENVRKDLRICLLSSEERSSHFTDALPVNNVKDSKEVKLKISQELLERLLASQPDFRHKCYEYRYNAFGDKILFYINESFERETAQDSIDFYKKVYDRIYSTKENT